MLPPGPPRRDAADGADASRLFAELDAKIEAGMTAYGIPGVAVGVVYGGREYLKGYGVTNADHPQAVDPDTVFRVGSTTKTFTVDDQDVYWHGGDAAG